MSATIIKEGAIYHRYSHVSDSFTHVDMSAAEYIIMCQDKARELATRDALEVLERHTENLEDTDIEIQNELKKLRKGVSNI